MANDATLDLTSPNAVAAGQIVRGDSTQGLAAVQNWVHAELACGVVVSQAWDDSLCSENPVSYTQVASWIIPVWDDSRTAIRIDYSASGPGAGAGVRFTSTNGADSATTATTGALADFTVASLDIADGGNGYEEVNMLLESSSTDVVVEDVSMEIIPLSSPLSAGKVGNFTPQGQTAMSADRPLSQASGDEWIDNLGTYPSHQHVILCWSGLDITGANEYLTQGRTYTGPTPVHNGSEEAGLSYTAWVTTDADPSDDTKVVIIAGVDGDWEVVNTTTIGAGGGTTTKTLTFELPERQTWAGFPVSMIEVGVTTAKTFEDVNSLHTTADVSRITIVGP